jgi:catechol 2,3-dioxygenase-like lactoylglutathione lyase family enzyme
MLESCAVVAFVPTVDLERARSFYEGVLGLAVLDHNPAACVVDAHGTDVRVTLVEQLTPAPFTVLGWSVPDIRAAISELSDRGVTFERFDGIDHDELGAWTAPGGARVAWFRDPDGNTLSITQPGPA